MDDLVMVIEAYVRAWHGVEPPNEAGRVLAGELAQVIEGFEAQRGRLRFEDEPSGFAAALMELGE